MVSWVATKKNMSNQRPYYLNNRKLKAANVDIEWTPEIIAEYKKCMASPVYFASHYVKIINADDGVVTFPIWDFQREMIELYHANRYCITKCPRQVGKSTTCIAYLLWYILFNDHKTVGIFAHKGDTSQELLGRLKFAFEQLPAWLQQGVEVWNKRSIELENGSKVMSFATDSATARGNTYNIVMLDEFAHVPNNIAEDFFRSVFPTISSGKTTKVIIVSTPCGMNMFYKFWTDSVEKRNTYANFSIHWSDVPGRDEKWKEDEIANTSEEQFQQEHECEFLGSVNTLISPKKLQCMTYITPTFNEDGLTIYKPPEENHQYVITVDVARGSGLDNSAFIIFDVSEFPYRIVGKYMNNKIPPMLFPDVIHRMGKHYNDAEVLVEINDIGGQIADMLFYDLEYENILFAASRGRSGQVIGYNFGPQTQKGIRTTDQLKRIGCSNLKTLIEEDKLIIEDFDIISELTTFVYNGRSYEADIGYNDDLAMCLVFFAWYTTQKFFEEHLKDSIRKAVLAQKMEYLEEEMMPFGYIDDGFDNNPGDRSVWEEVDMDVWF
jgi:hypothetical protein